MGSCAPPTEILSGWAGLGIRTCISDKFPGDADTAGPGTTILELLPALAQPPHSMDEEPKA